MSLRIQLVVAFFGTIIITSLFLGICYKLMWFDAYMTLMLTIYSVISSVITMVIALFFTVPTIKKIRLLNKSAQKIADGNYNLEKTNIQSPKELKELSMSFNQMTDEIKLQMDNIQKEQQEKLLMVENLAHDLKTPLASIKSYAEGLKDGVIKKEDQDKAYDVLMSQSERMSEMFDELTQIMTITDLSHNHELISIDRLLISLLDYHTPMMNKHHRNFIVNCTNEIKPFYQNRLAIERILSNFIGNAIKFSNEDIRIDLQENNDAVLISVVDNGIGIPEQYIDDVFKRTFRVEQSRNKSTGGSGLGLYIAKSLAEQIGSSISIQSKENEGTTITLIINKTQTV